MTMMRLLLSNENCVQGEGTYTKGYAVNALSYKINYMVIQLQARMVYKYLVYYVLSHL